MGDIFENIYPQANGAPNTPTAQPPAASDARPDPLPTENFRDAHEPKRRVSRFKASRQK